MPLRKPADAPAIAAHDHARGPKPSRKKRAVLGAVYQIDPYARTAGVVVEALFRDKAWMMAVTAASTFLPGLLPATSGDQTTATLAVALCFMLIGGPCIACWAILGAALQCWLRQGSRLHRFNIVMGLLLAAAALGMAWV